MLARRIALAAALAMVALAAAAAEPPRMTKEELKPLLGKPGVYVVDARAPGDWEGAKEKIAGAVREDPWHPDAWVGRYAKDSTIVLYCS